MKNLALLLDGLSVKRVENGVASAVGGGASALHLTFAIVFASYRQRRADKSCPRRCAKTVRPNVQVHKPRRARACTDIQWRPDRRASQSPLTVSYMCQRQSSSRHITERRRRCRSLRSDRMADRVGNTLVTHAVLRPACAAPNVARSPGAACTDNYNVIFVIDNFVTIGHWGSGLSR